MAKTYLLTAIFVAAVDLLLLLGSGRMMNRSVRWVRLMIGAGMGGLHGWLSLMTGFSFLGSGFWRMVVLIAVGCIVYDFDIPATAVFSLLNLAVNGLASGLGAGSVMALGIVFGLVLLARRGRCYGGHADVTIEHGTERIVLKALRDTGNGLRDPITGEQVLVVSSWVGQRLLGLSPWELAHPVQAVMKGNGLRLIPYHSVGGQGFLLGKRFGNVEVDGVKRQILIAFSPMEIGKGKGYEALTGGAA